MMPSRQEQTLGAGYGHERREQAMIEEGTWDEPAVVTKLSPQSAADTDQLRPRSKRARSGRDAHRPQRTCYARHDRDRRPVAAGRWSLAEGADRTTMALLGAADHAASDAWASRGGAFDETLHSITAVLPRRSVCRRGRGPGANPRRADRRERAGRIRADHQLQRGY